MNKCPKCEFEVTPGKPCENCEMFQRLQAAQARFKPTRAKLRLRQGPDKVQRAGRSGGWWMKKAKEHAENLASGVALPLAGQDAALPVGDR